MFVLITHTWKWYFELTKIIKIPCVSLTLTWALENFVSHTWFAFSFSFSLCVCIWCVFLYETRCTYTTVHMRRSEDNFWGQSSPSTLLETRGSLLFLAACTRLAGLPWLCRLDCLYLSSPIRGLPLEACATAAGFCVGSRDPNTGNQACTASTSSTEPLSPSISSPLHYISVEQCGWFMYGSLSLKGIKLLESIFLGPNDRRSSKREEVSIRQCGSTYKQA